MPIRILIAQEHGVLRSALRALIERHDDEFIVVGEARAIVEVADGIRAHDADVLILDCAMHRQCDTGYLTELLTVKPSLAVVVLGMCQDEPCVQRFFTSGARGYVLKTSAESELLSAVRLTSHGETYLDGALADCVSVGRRNGQCAETSPLPAALLTEREQEVCRLIAYGYTNAEVAEKLVVSGRTVEAHRARIMTKLKCKNRADLVRFALNNGLLKVHG